MGAHGGLLTLHHWSLSSWHLNAKCIQFHFRSPQTPASAIGSPISLHPCSKQESIPIPKLMGPFFPLDPQASLLFWAPMELAQWVHLQHSEVHFNPKLNRSTFLLQVCSKVDKTWLVLCQQQPYHKLYPQCQLVFLRIVSIIFIMWVCAGVCRCLWSRPAVSDARGTGVSGSGGSPNMDTENQAWVL